MNMISMDQHICIHTSCYVSKYDTCILNVCNYNGRERQDEEALITLFFFHLLSLLTLCCSPFPYGIIKVLMVLTNGEICGAVCGCI